MSPKKLSKGVWSFLSLSLACRGSVCPSRGKETTQSLHHQSSMNSRAFEKHTQKDTEISTAAPVQGFTLTVPGCVDPRAGEAMPPIALNIPAPRCQLLNTLPYSRNQGSLKKQSSAGRGQGKYKVSWSPLWGQGGCKHS